MTSNVSYLLFLDLPFQNHGVIESAYLCFFSLPAFAFSSLAADQYASRPLQNHRTRGGIGTGRFPHYGVSLDWGARRLNPGRVVVQISMASGFRPIEKQYWADEVHCTSLGRRSFPRSCFLECFLENVVVFEAVDLR